MLTTFHSCGRKFRPRPASSISCSGRLDRRQN